MQGLLVFVAVVVGAASFDTYDTENRIRSEGYHTETHHVTTSDGYILQVNRIPYRRHEKSSDNPDRPIVFCMHGLLAASNSYVLLGSETSLAFNLADAGFDVWMGNARGNRLSRNHVSLNPDHAKEKFDFFDFSWEEIGMIDVPEMIDYVLKQTGREKLHYIGHSQGGTSFLVMGSMRPEYNAKLESVHLLAGVGYMKHFPHAQMSSLAPLSDIIYNFALGIGMVELYPPDADARSGARSAGSCTADIRHSYMCDLVGANEIVRGSGTGGIFDNFEPAGAALKQIAHYGQNIRDKTFRRWNYGLLQNLKKYGSMNPPKYDLGLITADVTMHYTVSDILLDERDVLAMAGDMPNCKVRRVAREDFRHEDFVGAHDARELVNEYVIEQINAVSGFCR